MVGVMGVKVGGGAGVLVTTRVLVGAGVDVGTLVAVLTAWVVGMGVRVLVGMVGNAVGVVVGVAVGNCTELSLSKLTSNTHDTSASAIHASPPPVKGMLNHVVDVSRPLTRVDEFCVAKVCTT